MPCRVVGTMLSTLTIPHKPRVYSLVGTGEKHQVPLFKAMQLSWEYRLLEAHNHTALHKLPSVMGNYIAQGHTPSQGVVPGQ